ncbi:MAG: D-2-hydroxyacid dehydrogenase [Edaphobacter sp.]
MRLLIHDNVRKRNQGSFEALQHRLDLIVMGDDGLLHLNRAEISVDNAQPEVVFASADIFFSCSAQQFMVAVLKSRVLKWVQSGSAGFEHPVFGQIVQQGAQLTNSHGQAVGMADYVLWGVLDCLQNGASRRASQAERKWQRQPSAEIGDMQWLVIGFGAVGQGVGRRARAFGAHVTGVNRNLAPDPNADEIVPSDEILRRLPSTDVVVLAVPDTPQTRNIANGTFFEAMKPGSIFVNVGRGALVDEPALLKALDRGVPEHALLDVFATEPLPPDSQFWGHPSVTLTAHCSGMSRGNPIRNDASFLTNLNRYLAGEPLQNEVAANEVLVG